MPADRLIRPATRDDAAACAAIYAPYVRDTAVSFETQPPSAAEMADRIERATASHAWLVAESDGAVIGYAYAGPFASRPAYRWSCEVSIYLHQGRRRGGVGRTLYTELFNQLTGRGFYTVFAGMVEPHDASAGLHQAMGFTTVGTFRQVGYKLGAWRDVTWMQRRLIDTITAPAELH